MVGRTVGNYVIDEQVAQGGMGAIYLAHHSLLGRRVAVKVLLPHMVQNPDLVRRFFNEAKAATAIENEHIIDVIDFGQAPDGESFIVMEWLEGKSLNDTLQTEGKLPLDRARRIAKGLGKALAAAHANGIVHRDLKPDNIILVKRDENPDFVKVLDFGIAKLMTDAVEVKTQTGMIMGTPYYMSPEQCNGAAVDHRTDIYATGIILYQMLTGKLPFADGGLTEILIAQASKPPPPPRQLEPGIPAHVEAAILQALEKDPARRFQSITALMTALDAPQTAVALGSAPTGLASSVRAWAPPAIARGWRWWIALGGAGLLVLIVLIALLRKGGSPAPSATSTPTVAGDGATAMAVSGKWTLKKSECPPGAMQSVRQVSQTGGQIVVRASSFPDATGSISADGRYTIKSPRGTCKGRVTGNSASESCSNRFGSCRVSYDVSR